MIRRRTLALALGLLGACLLLAGLLVPATRGEFHSGWLSGPFETEEFRGSQSYLDVGPGDQLLILAVAITGMLLAALRRFAHFYFLSLAALLSVGFAFFAVRAPIPPVGDGSGMAADGPGRLAAPCRGCGGRPAIRAGSVGRKPLTAGLFHRAAGRICSRIVGSLIS